MLAAGQPQPCVRRVEKGLVRRAKYSGLVDGAGVERPLE